MPTDDFISCDFPDLDAFIKQLDLMKENVNKALRNALHEAGELIVSEQRRLADETGVPFLSPVIKAGQIEASGGNDVMLPWGKIVTSSPLLKIKTGYFDDAFNYQDTNVTHLRTHTTNRHGFTFNGDYWKRASKEKPGVIGLLYEFGRPGKSTAHHRNQPDMEQIRLRIPNKQGTKRKNWQEAIPTKVRINKGVIQPRPHIRRGFDNVKGRAAQTVIEAYNREIDKLGDK